jgi:uroporphyrinogen-III synthase
LLYLAGEDRAGDLGTALAAHGLNADTVAIYRVVPAATLPPDIAQALSSNQLDGVLHYSPRSAATLLRLVHEAGALPALAGLAHYCLSDAVAAPLREAGARRISVAPHPDEAALFGLI